MNQSKMFVTTVSITEEEKQFLEKNCISISKLIRQKIQELKSVDQSAKIQSTPPPFRRWCIIDTLSYRLFSQEKGTIRAFCMICRKENKSGRSVTFRSMQALKHHLCLVHKMHIDYALARAQVYTIENEWKKWWQWLNL